MRLFNQALTKTYDFGNPARLNKYPRMSGDPNDSTQNHGSYAKPRLSLNNAVQPAPAKTVVSGIGPKCVYKYIHIGENHKSCIRSSRSPDRFRSMPGRVPPEALAIGTRTRVRRRGCGLASTVLRPSSRREVRVRPSSDAFFFALRSRSSETLTVVRICRSIFSRHQYVNCIWKSLVRALGSACWPDRENLFVLR